MVTILAFAFTLQPGALAGESPKPRTPPGKLSETGLYANIATKTVARSNLKFSPQYPLWSDGATKARWISIPRGSSIDATKIDAFVFPVGTKFWKEFSFGKRVETRYLEKATDGSWIYAAYAWDAKETDAYLVPVAGLPNHVEIAPGVRHDIPSVEDCKTCHEGEGRDIPLGFTALQLSPERDPNAPHAEPRTPDMVTLKTLAERKLIVHVDDRFIRKPPVIPGSSPVARAALGYMSANCGGCHNSGDPLSSVGMFLKRSANEVAGAPEREMSPMFWRESKYQISGKAAGQSFRIAPGDPSRSAVIVRMNTRNPYGQMPPLGTKLVDADAVKLITRWISEDLAARK
jgi:hypothetical protein